MRCNPARWLWGVIPILLLSWLTYQWELGRIEADLMTRASNALERAGHGWASARFSGRDAVLTGLAESETEPKAARESLDGLWGVRVVELNTDLARTVADYRLRATRSDKRIVLDGIAPSRNARDRIKDTAGKLFPGFTVEDRMTIGRGPGDLNQWLAGITFGLNQLSALTTGSIDLDGFTLSIAGQSNDPANYRTIRKALADDRPKGMRIGKIKLALPTISPFTWNARRAGEQVTLSGYVPSEDVRGRLLAKARKLFGPTQIVDRMEVAQGAPSGWPGVADWALGILARLEQGVADLSGSDLSFEGTGDETLVSGKFDTPGSYRVKRNITLSERALSAKRAADEKRAEAERKKAADAEARAGLEAEQRRAEEERVRAAEAARAEAEARERAEREAEEARARAEREAEEKRAEEEQARAAEAARAETEARERAEREADEAAAARVEAERRLAELEAEAERARRAYADAVRASEGTPSEQPSKPAIDVDALRDAYGAAVRAADGARGTPDEPEAAAPEPAPARPSIDIAALREAYEKSVRDAEAAAPPPVAAEPAEATPDTSETTAYIPPERKEAADRCQTQLTESASKGAIRFALGSADLVPASLPTLDSLAEIADACPEARIEVEGHTDSDGTASFNQGLSERRARSVTEYLAGAGVKAERLGAVGYGASRPVVPNDTDENRARNRRIEFTVIAR